MKDGKDREYLDPGIFPTYGGEWTDMGGMNAREEEEFLGSFGTRKQRKAFKQREKARKQAEKQAKKRGD
jgi:hypothetical protein